MMFAAISPAGVPVSMSRSAKCSAQPSRSSGPFHHILAVSAELLDRSSLSTQRRRCHCAPPSVPQVFGFAVR